MEQVTVLPQPSEAVPRHLVPQMSTGVQPHVFGFLSGAPPHVFGATHVLGQVTVWPQLFVFGPHATPAHVVASGSGVQQLVPTHTPPALQPCGQPIVCPQLLVTLTPPQRPLHAAPLSEQHEPSALQIAPAVAH